MPVEIVAYNFFPAARGVFKVTLGGATALVTSVYAVEHEIANLDEIGASVK